MINPITPEHKAINPARQDEKGRFLPGVRQNPDGPKPGYRQSAYKEMDKAIAEYQEEHGCSYWKAAVVMAMQLAQKGNVTLLCKVIDKFCPTKIEITDDEAPHRLPFSVRGPNAN
jgi:hypothetical protein